jgi:hypothetical protein
MDRRLKEGFRHGSTPPLPVQGSGFEVQVRGERRVVSWSKSRSRMGSVHLLTADCLLNPEP